MVKIAQHSLTPPIAASYLAHRNSWRHPALMSDKIERCRCQWLLESQTSFECCRFDLRVSRWFCDSIASKVKDVLAYCVCQQNSYSANLTYVSNFVLFLTQWCRPQPPPEVTKPPGVLEVRPAPGLCTCDRHDWSPHFERARYLKNAENCLMEKLLDVREEVNVSLWLVA